MFQDCSAIKMLQLGQNSYSKDKALDMTGRESPMDLGCLSRGVYWKIVRRMEAGREILAISYKLVLGATWL